ncbi:unnamed protein product [Urochloa decumbens]|uniref:Uncharacterized protein n=1 Tax=Urochloa decumbens TaxID=240449 RepID=A0ABC9B1I9_9POAL
MALGAAGLRAAAAIAVFTVLVMSSQGHPRTKPLCSDCSSLCNTNCTAEIAEKCINECSFQGACDQCESQVLQSCCQNFCSSSDGTSSFSCCPNGTSSVTCNCGNCNSAAQSSCTSPCSELSCMSCQFGIGQQCRDSCMSACKENCVNYDC